MSERTERYSAGFNTCTSILEALSRIAADVPFEKISVASICEEADVSRATFYYHFRDKHDVMQWHFGYVSSSNLREIGRTLTWAEGYRKNTLEVAKYKDLYRAAFSDRGYQSIFKHAKRDRIKSLHETLRDYRHIEIDDELEFQIQALADVEVGSISRWFKEGMNIDVDLLCGYLERVIPKRIHDLLDIPA